jgi:phosphopentomutase
MAALMTCNGAPEDGFMKREMTPEYEKVLVQLDGRIKELHEALPSGTMFVVASGHGDIASVRR